jgi:hypothetical protein
MKLTCVVGNPRANLRAGYVIKNLQVLKLHHDVCIDLALRIELELQFLALLFPVLQMAL